MAVKLKTDTDVKITEYINEIKLFFKNILLNNKYNYQKITYKIDNKTIYIIKIVLNDEEHKPVLFTIPGLSHTSFLRTSEIIISKLDVLVTKFKAIYLIEYESFKDDMKDAFTEQQKEIDKVGGEEKFEEMSLDEKLEGEFFNSVYKTNTIIAKLTKNIIISLELSNIHLLGKCNGSWIATILITLDDRFKGLYLAVACIPFSVKDLEKINSKKLEEIKFIFGWTLQDTYDYIWGVKSFEEKERYDLIMKNFKEKYTNINYKSFMYDYNCAHDSFMYHEIHPEMIDDIINSIDL